jgi:formylglycine-generating enzyme required for sulfatase activity
LPLAYRTSDEEQEFQNSTRHLQLWEEFDIGQWSKQIGRDRVNQNWCQCPPLVGSTREIASWLNERRDKNSTDSDWFWFRQGSVPNVGYGDEGPRHWWRVKRFWLQATAVTVEQYLLFDPQHRAIYADSFEKTAREPDCPVIGVSWYDAAMFAVWVGDQCRLPTESEWEFACRAGHDNEGDLYSLADGPLRDISPQHANYGNKVGETLPVRWDAGRRDTWRSSQGAERPPAFLPNQWGLWQMHGNVWEWCANLAEYDFSDDDLDRWVEAKQKLSAEYQKRLDRNNELGKLSQTPPASVQPEAEESQMFTVGPSRVLRGGSWDNGGGRLRCAYRLDNDPEPLIVNIGFRLCWES